MSEVAAPENTPPATTLPLVYTKSELADALQVSVTTLDKMRAENRLPNPLQSFLNFTGKNKTLYWSRVAIQNWVEAGCPDVAAWERQRR